MRSLATVLAVQIIAHSAMFVPSYAEATGKKTSQKAAKAGVCVNVENNKQRLKCYDLFYKGLRLPDADTYLGKWRVNTGPSPKDGSNRAIIRVQGNTGQLPKGFRDLPIFFYAACRNDTTNFWFYFGQIVKHKSKTVPISYTADDKKPFKIEMSKSHNRHSLGRWDDGKSRNFLVDLFGAKSLSIELEPEGEGKIKVQFDVAGLHNAIKPVAKVCRWPGSELTN